MVVKRRRLIIVLDGLIQRRAFCTLVLSLHSDSCQMLKGKRLETESTTSVMTTQVLPTLVGGGRPQPPLSLFNNLSSYSCTTTHIVNNNTKLLLL